jgi:hypothetical protein
MSFDGSRFVIRFRNTHVSHALKCVTRTKSGAAQRLPHAEYTRALDQPRSAVTTSHTNGTSRMRLEFRFSQGGHLSRRA